MDYIITNSESQSHTPIIIDWTATTSYQLEYIYTYNK